MATGLRIRLIAVAASVCLALMAAAAAPPPAPPTPPDQPPAQPPEKDPEKNPEKPPAPPAPPAKKKALTIRDAMRLLTDEGKAVRSRKIPPPARPDFASRFESSLDQADAGRALIKQANPDPFIDAYIRWQLTSFDPPLPAMDDSAFARFMDAAPPMVENPRAGAKVMLLLHNADGAGPLTMAELEHLRAIVADAEARAKQAEAMNIPALEFRSWVAQRLGQTGPRPRQWLLERCAATVRAAWSTSLVKGDISRQFSASAGDETFTPQQRQMVAEQAKRLIGLSRQSFEKVAFMADSSVKPSFSTSDVDEKDVEKWIKRLMGEAVDDPANPRG